MRYDFDLIVIGSGAGGSVGAHYAAGLGKKVAVVEKSIVGGECPNFACVPTKALLHAAEIFDSVKRASDYGAKTRGVTLDFKKVRAWKNAVVRRTGTSHGVDVFKKNGVTLINGTAKFINPHEIMVGPRRYSADKFIIATGSSVFVPPIPGLEDAGYMIFHGAVDLERVPKSLFILGGGPIGCEFTQIYSTFGTRVVLMDSLPRLLAKEDEEVGMLVQALFENRGVNVITNASVKRVKKQGEKRVIYYELGGQEHSVSVEKILIATGKRPNLDLDLERARVVFDKRGIAVNPYLQTTSPNIFAAGDVIGPFLFTHTGEYQSHIAAHNAFSIKKIKPDYRVVPRCVYTSPEVASVGMSEQDAVEKKIKIKKGIAPFSAIGRSNTSNALDGFAKVITDSKGTLIGGAVIGPRAGEIIHELAMAIKFHASADDVAGMIHAYPTYSEALKIACASVE